MKGFGYFDNFSELQKVTARFEGAELINMETEYPDDVDNVRVPLLSDDKYSGKPKGSAGTENETDNALLGSEEDEEEFDDSIFDSFGSLGGKGFASQMEGFSPGDVVDDTSEKEAKNRTIDSKKAHIDTSDISTMFKEMFSKEYNGPGSAKKNQNTIIDLGIKNTFGGKASTINVGNSYFSR